MSSGSVPPSEAKIRSVASARRSDEGEGRGAGPEVLRQVEGAAALRIQLRPRHAFHGPVRLLLFSLQEPLDLVFPFRFWVVGLMAARCGEQMDFAEFLIPFEIWLITGCLKLLAF